MDQEGAEVIDPGEIRGFLLTFVVEQSFSTPMNTKSTNSQAAEEHAFETKDVDIFGPGSEVFPYLNSAHVDAINRESRWPHTGSFIRDIHGPVDDESIKYLVRRDTDRFIRARAVRESGVTLVSGVGLFKTEAPFPPIKAGPIVQAKPKLGQLGGTNMGLVSWVPELASKLLSETGLPDIKCKFICSWEAARYLGPKIDGLEVVVDHDPIRLSFGKGGYKAIEPEIIVKHKGEAVAVPNQKFLKAKYEVGVVIAGSPLLLNYTAKTLVGKGVTRVTINMPSAPRCIPVIYRR